MLLWIRRVRVHLEVIIKRLRDPWRAAGLRSEFRRLVEAGVQKITQDQSVRVNSHGFYVTTDRGSANIVRVPAGGPDDPSYRTIAEIPPSELRLALVSLIGDAREDRPRGALGSCVENLWVEPNQLEYLRSIIFAPCRPCVRGCDRDADHWHIPGQEVIGTSGEARAGGRWRIGAGRRPRTYSLGQRNGTHHDAWPSGSRDNWSSG